VEVPDIEALHAELAGRARAFARPGLVDQPWGAREMAVTDPFGTTIVFWQAMPD
jgi:uncharacterized glyoxalase superfamily protein PhnB